MVPILAIGLIALDFLRAFLIHFGVDAGMVMFQKLGIPILAIEAAI